MNRDVPIFNRAFRFAPGIRHVTRSFAEFDNWLLNLPRMHGAGLQVVGKAEKPKRPTMKTAPTFTMIIG
jgi:hypothetical protein